MSLLSRFFSHFDQLVNEFKPTTKHSPHSSFSSASSGGSLGTVKENTSTVSKHRKLPYFYLDLQH